MQTLPLPPYIYITLRNLRNFNYFLYLFLVRCYHEQYKIIPIFNGFFFEKK